MLQDISQDQASYPLIPDPTTDLLLLDTMITINTMPLYLLYSLILLCV